MGKAFVDGETQIEKELKEKFLEVDMPVSFCTYKNWERAWLLHVNRWAGSSDQSQLLQDIGAIAFCLKIHVYPYAKFVSHCLRDCPSYSHYQEVFQPCLTLLTSCLFLQVLPLL